MYPIHMQLRVLMHSPRCPPPLLKAVIHSPPARHLKSESNISREAAAAHIHRTAHVLWYCNCSPLCILVMPACLLDGCDWYKRWWIRRWQHFFLPTLLIHDEWRPTSCAEATWYFPFLIIHLCDPIIFSLCEYVTKSERGGGFFSGMQRKSFL